MYIKEDHGDNALVKLMATTHTKKNIKIKLNLLNTTLKLFKLIAVDELGKWCLGDCGGGGAVPLHSEIFSVAVLSGEGREENISATHLATSNLHFQDCS